MDTLLRERGDVAQEDVGDLVTPDLATPDLATLEPREAELGVDHAWPHIPDAAPDVDTAAATPTYLHPMVIVVTAAGYGWFLLAFWVAFADYGYMAFTMGIATLISGSMLGLMVAGVVGGRNMTPWQRHWASFQEFLDGHVEVWGSRVSGRDVFYQLAGMSWLLAGLATAFAVIVACVRTT